MPRGDPSGDLGNSRKTTAKNEVPGTSPQDLKTQGTHNSRSQHFDKGSQIFRFRNTRPSLQAARVGRRTSGRPGREVSQLADKMVRYRLTFFSQSLQTMRPKWSTPLRESNAFRQYGQIARYLNSFSFIADYLYGIVIASLTLPVVVIVAPILTICTTPESPSTT